MKEKRIIYLIMGVSSILILLIGITTAWFTWQSEVDTNVTFEVSGLNITSTNTNITGTLYPTMDKNNGVVEEFTIKQNNDISTPVCANITLTLTTLPTELNHESFRYKISQSFGRITAPATTGPARGPLPTSSIPQI